MGAHGNTLIQDGFTILHHCNTGALAAVDFGTALGVVRAAHEAGKQIHVLLDETRPRLQGARLSAWELDRMGVSYDILPIPPRYYMQKGEAIWCWWERIGRSQRRLRHKIGTYQVAVMAERERIPFYNVAPTSTVDLSLETARTSQSRNAIGRGDDAYGLALVPAHFKARNPAFDVTTHRYLWVRDGKRELRAATSARA